MATKYKFGDNRLPHFITFAVVNWIDVFTRERYKELVVDSLKFCIKEKGLNLHAWVIMSNHVHLIASAREGFELVNIIRDLKKYTSKMIISSIESNQQESRKDWMLWLFKRAGLQNSNNKIYQFWQQDNHPVELNTNKMIEQRLNYLHENPVESGLVTEAQYYKYSSATDYYEEKSGLVPVSFM
ncbi:REP-associated tyrosine transposase [Pedobacter xixiisoli]|uniref:REP element-mobilizing transposase RayT n=1 Tax=Pedobacter xixiisoli TaxID=1476464 RepID=A0A286AEP5_9SPHI|nr:transposase [Pedobacter xixiisoli]SOD20357.1 REP element-mobilizing transposase RayT [Pedobacter xixiisoli]